MIQRLFFDLHRPREVHNLYNCVENYVNIKHNVMYHVHVRVYVCVYSTVWRYSTLKGRRLRHARRRTKAEWWRGSTSPTYSEQPAQTNVTTGSSPSGESQTLGSSVHLSCKSVKMETNGSFVRKN